TANCKENVFIELMQKVPDNVEVSSLPKLYDNGWATTISVNSYDKELTDSVFEQFINLLDDLNISYKIEE
ncbi:MAG: competence/damage-inducible protein A, partial [Epsilonproteobacteria bacterium]|nr:competence/damage-inducible protein A [Campylobacterota bacterium]